MKKILTMLIVLMMVGSTVVCYASESIVKMKFVDSNQYTTVGSACKSTYTTYLL